MAKTAKDWETEIAAREAATEAHWKAKLEASERTHKAKEDESERKLDDAHASLARNAMIVDSLKNLLSADNDMLNIGKGEIDRLRDVGTKIGALVESAGSLVDALRALSEGSDLINPILDAIENNGMAIDDMLEAFETAPAETEERLMETLADVDAAVSDLIFWTDLDAKIDAESAAEEFADEPTVKISVEPVPFKTFYINAEPASEVESDFFRRGGVAPLSFDE
jgi:hypothetical protein